MMALSITIHSMMTISITVLSMMTHIMNTISMTTSSLTIFGFMDFIAILRINDSVENVTRHKPFC